MKVFITFQSDYFIPNSSTDDSSKSYLKYVFPSPPPPKNSTYFIGCKVTEAKSLLELIQDIKDENKHTGAENFTITGLTFLTDEQYCTLLGVDVNTLSSISSITDNSNVDNNTEDIEQNNLSI